MRQKRPGGMGSDGASGSSASGGAVRKRTLTAGHVQRKPAAAPAQDDGHGHEHDDETRDLDARNDEHRGDAYRVRNPHRKMPTLEVGDEIITESVAILLMLDERHPAGALLPPSGSRARPRLAQVWARHIR